MSFQKYRKYKDSGVNWIGEIPAHWTLGRIRKLARIVGGGTPNRERTEFWNGNVPWVSPKDMKSEMIETSEESITELGLNNCSSARFPPGNVLMVIRSGILQHTLPVAINSVSVAINQDLKAFWFDRLHCNPYFFLRWVQGLNDKLILAWANEGATVESLNQRLIRSTFIPMPPLDEQLAIVDFLNRETAKIDALVSEQRRLVELLKEKRQAVINQAITKGLALNVQLKSSDIEWLGDVPEQWKIYRIGSLYSDISENGSDALPIL